jgi:hypothetical protein
MQSKDKEKLRLSDGRTEVVFRRAGAAAAGPRPPGRWMDPSRRHLVRVFLYLTAALVDRLLDVPPRMSGPETVLITGASSGIGREPAHCFFPHGRPRRAPARFRSAAPPFRPLFSMSPSGKNTVPLDEDEFRVLDTIRRAAPRHGLSPKLAQAYGAWTLCFRRYCQDQDRPWLWMSSVSDFMDFLDAHPTVSDAERNRALDGIMFYITDVHDARTASSSDAADGSGDGESVPRSTQSLFARMLLRCDVQLGEALHLRRDDVRLDDDALYVSGSEDRASRTVSLPSLLREGLRHYVERVEDRTTTVNPRLFGPYEPAVRTDPAADPGTEEELDRSTELATQVMQTFGDPPADDE